jgi:hypothetical protein
MASWADVGWELVKAISSAAVGFLAGRWTKRADAKQDDQRVFVNLVALVATENLTNRLPVRLLALREFLSVHPTLLQLPENAAFWTAWLDDPTVTLGREVVDVRWTRARVESLRRDLAKLRYK